MATFGYVRVSTLEQTVENQRMEIEAAGFAVDYWFEENGVSGSVPALERPAFADMRSKIRKGETLVTAKLDRLGRNAADVLTTVERLQADDIRVIVLALGHVDLASATGKLILSVLAGVAEMELALLRERTKAGLVRARSEGKVLGRPAKLDGKQKTDVLYRLSQGDSVSSLARAYKVSRATIIEVRKAEQAGNEVSNG